MMTPMVNVMRECSTCAHWHKLDDPTEQAYGECHRFPPVPLVMGEELVHVWPVTDADGVCGERSQVELVSSRAEGGGGPAMAG